MIGPAAGLSTAQLAWMLRLSPVVIRIPGASKPGSITSSAQAADLELTDEDMAEHGSQAFGLGPMLGDPGDTGLPTTPRV